MLGALFRYVRREIASAVFQGSVDGVDRAVRFFSGGELQIDREAAEATAALPHTASPPSLPAAPARRKGKATT